MSNVFEYARSEFGAATLPSFGQRVKLNAFFLGMEDVCGECLSDLDLFYNFATDGDDNWRKINWAGPGTFQLVQTGVVTSTPNSDFQGGGGYFTTDFTPSLHAVHYTQNDASVFCAIMNDVAENTITFGCNGPGVASSSILFSPRRSDGAHHFRINSPVDSPHGSGVVGDGFYHPQRVNSIISRLHKNGSQVGADNNNGTVAGTPIQPITLFANNNNGTIGSFSTSKMGCFGVGPSLIGKEAELPSTWNAFFLNL